MFQQIAVGELALCTVVWLLALIWPSRHEDREKQAPGTAAIRLGILMNLAAFALVLARVRPQTVQTFLRGQSAVIASMVLAFLALLLSVTARQHFRRRWVYNERYGDFVVLVKSGPYGIVRHPMYTASLCMLLAAGIAWATTPILLAGIVTFLVGLELRLYGEELALVNRFQDEFAEYQSMVKAYIPFVR